MAEITPDDFPGGLSAIVQQYELEKHLQFRTGTGARAIGHTAIFHGQGSRSDDLKTRVVEYLREIDRRVIRELAGKRSPLVLVGVDYLLATYRTINTYSHLFDADISGSPEAWSRQKLLQKSRTISELLFKAACREASDRYRALANTDRASNDVSKIVGAAYNGRVASLFVPLEVSAGGKFESESETVEIHQRAGADVEDLLDQSAVLTFLTGGEVFAVDPGDVPGDGTLAAVFRY
jgi:hypothetical protein